MRSSAHTQASNDPPQPILCPITSLSLTFPHSTPSFKITGTFVSRPSLLPRPPSHFQFRLQFRRPAPRTRESSLLRRLPQVRKGNVYCRQRLLPVSPSDTAWLCRDNGPLNLPLLYLVIVSSIRTPSEPANRHFLEVQLGRRRVYNGGWD
jgi:hypothetical protein